MSRLLFYHDFASPYCRLAVNAAVEATRRSGLELRPVPFELWPPPEPLPDLHEPALAEELETAAGIAEDWGAELHTPSAIPRTRKAHEAVAYGIDHDTTIPILQGIYAALWSDDRDISRIDVLADIADAAGLDAEEVHVALGTDRYEADVVREQHAVAGAGIDAIPAFQLGAVMAAGLLSADELEAWIRDNG